MKTFLLQLLLASLLLALAHSLTPFERFKYLHTYSKRQPFDCTQATNVALDKVDQPCRPTNCFILGDNADQTQTNDVINVCRGQGTPVGHNNFRSNKPFRTVKCKQVGSGGWPPRCVYRAQPIVTSQITVGCSGGNPSHFETC